MTLRALPHTLKREVLKFSPKTFFLILSASTCIMMYVCFDGKGGGGLMRLGKYFNRLLEKIGLLFGE